MEKQRKEIEMIKLDQLGSTVSEIALGLENLVERNKEYIENHVNTLHSAALRTEVDTLNESLRKELTESLTTLAGHFESLSNGFVEDYELNWLCLILKRFKRLKQFVHGKKSPKDWTQLKGC